LPRDKVLSVASVMKPGQDVGNRGAGDGISARAKIAEVAEQVVDADGPLKVIDETGQTVGTIDAETVIGVLVGKKV